MEMTKEALELLQTTAQKAAGVTVVNLPGDGRTAYVAINGAIQSFAVPPPPRNHRVLSLEALATIALELGNSTKSAIYHNDGFVTFVVDDTDRRDTVEFQLTPSFQWQRLTTWNVLKESMSQKDAIAFLRLIFNADPQVIAGFRKIDFKTGSTATSGVDRGKESLGKSIESEILNARDIPETITLSSPIYSNPGEDAVYDVVCMVELDAQNARVQIVPEPGRLDELIDLHQQNIAKRLAALLAKEDGEAIPVYYGHP